MTLKPSLNLQTSNTNSSKIPPLNLSTLINLQNRKKRNPTTRQRTKIAKQIDENPGDENRAPRKWKQVESRRKEGEGKGGTKRRFSFRPLSGYTIQEPIMGVISFGGRQLRATVYTRRDRQSQWRSCTDTLLRSVSDATSGAIYCLTACSSRTGVYLLPWNDRRIPFSPFSAEGGTITIASDNERALEIRSGFYSLSLALSCSLPFCRSYKSSIGFDPRHSRFSLAGPIFENDLSPRIGGCASWWWTVYGPIVTRRVPLSGGVIVVSIRITE